MSTEPSYQRITADFKAAFESRIPTELLLSDLPKDVSNLVSTSGLLDPAEVDIVQMDATGLRDALASRQVSAVAVTTAFLKAAGIAHGATNCLMDYFPEEALETARYLDAEMERTGKPVGPMHGVPISIKDQMCVKGREITASFASWVGKNVPEKDGVFVRILREAGAVFYVKTSIPQAIMHLETDSFLGPTLNPYNRELTSGGSSGGEGALIGCRGSPMGLGTDIGGSIRNPAALNGIYGFKPTATRLPKGGNRAPMAGQESIPAAIGPLARSARDLSLCIETVLAAEPWHLDPTQVGMKWRPDEVVWKGGDKPKIGVMWDDGVVVPQAPMRKALKLAVEKLRAEGYEVFDYRPFKQSEGWDIITSLYFTDGGQTIRNAIEASGEPMLPLTKWILEQNQRDRPALELFQLIQRREAFKAEYNAHFAASGVDVILCLPGPGPAPILGTSKYWCYTSIFNLVDYPAGVLPTGTFVGLEDVREPEREFLSEQDREVWAAYSPEKMIGAPLALQVVAGRWEDEKALLALQMIDQVLLGK
ncbi:amidase signature domain-containing protein [Dioszegia hungarica]|uniref:amidase n=1 Tax=Dioszegia hungarica TaxID=4972 RepID=A0AA38HE90_9TREE|nr:amidase signature domain-containing protein [Dioszegia hungarica]KAI9638645.1 amidase signature domain-containing protein [Dioszegia hungarica]